MRIDRAFHTLAEAMDKTGLSYTDILHLAANRKIALLTGLPQGITLKVFDTLHGETYVPFLVVPNILVLQPSYCSLLALNSQSSQSDFPEGYLIRANGELQPVHPSYGYPNLVKDRLVWRTYREHRPEPVLLSADRLCLLNADLTRLADSQRPKVASPKKKAAIAETAETPQDLEPCAQSVQIIQTETGQASLSLQSKDERALSVDRNQTAQQPTKIIRLKDVTDRTGLSRSTIYDKMNERSPRYDPAFPKQIKLGASSVGWIEAQIDAWLVSRISTNQDG